MLNLKELLEAELKNTDSAKIKVSKLIEAAKTNPEYTNLVGGLGRPYIGVQGNWSKKEKTAIISMANACNQGHSLGHDFGKAMTGQDDPIVARYRTAYETVEAMKPGDVARVKLEDKAYLVAALPPRHMLSTSLVLFLN